MIATTLRSTRSIRSTLLIAAPLLLVVACSEGGSGKASAAAAKPAAAPPAAAAPAAPAASAAHGGSTGKGDVVAAATIATATVHGVKCGCAIEEIGACGNYIEVDGKYVALETPEVLSPMAFCGKSGLHAKAEGKVEDDVFVATSFALEP